MAEKKVVKIIKEKDEKGVPFAFKVTMNIVSIAEDATVQEAAKILEKNKIGAVLVKKDNKMSGIVSERDIAYRAVAKGLPCDKTLVRDIMTSDVVTINLEDGLDAIHKQLKNLPFRHLPVRQDGNIVGMVSSRDLMFLKRLKTINPEK